MNVSRFSKLGITWLAVIIILGSTGTVYAQYSGSLEVTGIVHANYQGPLTWVASNDNGLPENASRFEPIDPGDNGLDPSGQAPYQSQIPGNSCSRLNMDVAETTASLGSDRHSLWVLLDNAYPGYCSTVFFGLKNMNSNPSVIESISIDTHEATNSELIIDCQGISERQVINAGCAATGILGICIQQRANEDHLYYVTLAVALGSSCSDQEGTIGFWKNWNKHNIYSNNQIAAWLQDIDSESAWLGPPNTTGMVTIMSHTPGNGNSMEHKFLAQYLATRMNAESGRLNVNGIHNVSGIDSGNYLNLSNPASVLLQDIIQAIESKYGKAPSKQQLEIMKNVCEALNNLQL